MIIDDFLTTFDTLREYADSATFEDVENDADGVVYPQICEDIPSECRDEDGNELSRSRPTGLKDEHRWAGQAPRNWS